jgi:hypothetical protein
MQRRQFVPLLAFAVLDGSNPLRAAAQDEQDSSQARVAWVQRILERMQTIKPGMTRKQLLEIFTDSGGISAPDQAEFVSRDCSFFRVNITFRLTGKADAQGRRLDSPSDVILTMSQFYLGFDPMD